MSEFEEEEANAELSPEEKLQIAQHYLLSSPPGQFHEVLTDVKKIVPIEILDESLIAGIARVFNVKNSKVLTSPTGQKIVLNQAGEIDPTHYFDSKSGSVISVDHLTLTTKDDFSESNQDQTLEQIRSTLQTAINGYTSRFYPTEDAAAGVFAKDGALVVAVAGERTNLKNFWSGRWTSAWNVSVDLHSNTFTISGEIKVHVHYFEDGNLQLQSLKTIPIVSLAFENENNVAESIVKHISANESLVQSSLQDMYANMNEETFRSMRRIMPITRTKMEWNVNAVRMIKQTKFAKKKLWSTPKEVILASIMLLKPSGCDVVYDIGAGEGNFIIECAKQFNVKCIGVEIDEERCKLAESLILANGISNDICSIICENALSLDYAQGTCFFLYLIPRGLKLILPMLMNIQHRIRIVTYMSPLPNLTPIEVFKVSAIHSEAQWPLYYYELGN